MCTKSSAGPGGAAVDLAHFFEQGRGVLEVAVDARAESEAEASWGEPQVAGSGAVQRWTVGALAGATRFGGQKRRLSAGLQQPPSAVSADPQLASLGHKRHTVTSPVNDLVGLHGVDVHVLTRLREARPGFAAPRLPRAGAERPRPPATERSNRSRRRPPKPPRRRRQAQRLSPASIASADHNGVSADDRRAELPASPRRFVPSAVRVLSAWPARSPGVGRRGTASRAQVHRSSLFSLACRYRDWGSSSARSRARARARRERTVPIGTPSAVATSS